MEPLVTTDWLADNLEDRQLRILDCTVFVRPTDDGGFGPVSGLKEWSEGHIPGSGFADLAGDLSDSNHELPLMMPPPEQFAEAMGRYGVGPGTRVVLYDRMLNRWAARVWWMLRVCGFDDAAVLSGGRRKWTADGREVSTAPADYPAATFEPRPRPNLIATRDEVLAAIESGSTCLMNALTPEEHSGEVSMYGRPGHIPGSVNVSARDILHRPTHEYLLLEELRSLVAPTGALEADRVVTYCGGGVAASSDAFVLTLLGQTNVAVYDGSLLEWAPDPDLPMSTDD
jgi:thiosulfate/3-mercaptopyruvate sulfurtransferase